MEKMRYAFTLRVIMETEERALSKVHDKVEVIATRTQSLIPEDVDGIEFVTVSTMNDIEILDRPKPPTPTPPPPLVEKP